MNKGILLFSTLAFTLGASANILLVDNFNYTNGPLTSVSGSLWFPHSDAGLQSVQVTNGQVRVVGAGIAEDVDSALAAGPYLTLVTNSPGALYASFKVRFTSLPSAAGTYFAHYRDPNFAYPCRVYASIANAPPNQFRLGIINGGSGTAGTAQLTQNLSLNTDYIVVTCITLSNALGTIWLNPTAQTDPNVTAGDATSGATTGINSFAFRQASGGGICLVDNLRVGNSFSEVISTNNPPTISRISDITIAPNTSVGPIPFKVGDVETPTNNLLVTGTSSNPGLLPNSGILVSGSGTNCFATLNPIAAQTGSAMVILSVTDGDGLTTITTFNLFVGVPSISCIRSQEIVTNSSTGPVAFTIADPAEAVTNLSLTAISSNTNLIPVSDIVFGGTGAQRTVTVTPVPGQSGVSTITVTLSDGIQSDSSSFTVTVFPLIGPVLNEPFAYPDNTSLVSVGGWINSGGIVGQTKVVGGKLLLSSTNTEAFYHPLSGAPFVSSSGSVLFASFRVNYRQLPSSLGTFFAGFGSSTVVDRCRLWANTRLAPAGTFRLGITLITTDFNSIDFHPTILSLNTDHLVVIRYDIATGVPTLWVDPVSDLSPSISAPPDFFTADTITSFAFLQAGGIGTLSLDDLKSGTSFSDVVTNAAVDFPQLFLSTRCDSGLEIDWQAALTNFVLQQTFALDGTWQDYTDQGVVLGYHRKLVFYNYTGQSFFRLHKP